MFTATTANNENVHDRPLLETELAMKSTEEHGNISCNTFIFSWLPWISWPLNC